MEQVYKALPIACIPLLFCASATMAQEEEQAAVPIEAYLCNYVDGKGRSDLDRVVVKWNKWMDDNKAAPYSAWVMEPVLHSVNTPIDVVWLGAWQNGNAMGQGMQEWITNGGLLQAEFNKVLDCAEHSNAASVNIRPPQDDWPAESGVAVFANCTVDDDKTLDDAMAASAQWAEYLDAIGSRAGMWAFFSLYGVDNPDWDYKVVSTYPDYIAFGADWEAYTNEEGWKKGMEIGEGIVECDSPRVYHSTTVRDGGINPTSE